MLDNTPLFVYNGYYMMKKGEIRMSNWETEINKHDNAVALDEQNWQKNKTELADLSSGVKDDSTFLSETIKMLFGASKLSSREIKILKMRFGIGMKTDHSLEEVGRQIGVTRERIRQIEAKALRKLRRPARDHKLQSFLIEEIIPESP